MALIKCSECGKEVSENAEKCIHCGNPISNKQSNEEVICCPKCRSSNLYSGKRGFSGKKAVVGGILTGGIGILAGTIGSNKIVFTCMKCGKKFKYSEALIKRGDYIYNKKTSSNSTQQAKHINTPEELKKENQSCFVLILIAAIILITISYMACS